jgi:formylglycine-generating enzyme required for sulfatase activity
MDQRTALTGHVFICYAREDQDFVLELARNLKERGVPIWLDQWDIPISADWDLSIDDALYDCAYFLIVLSPAAVGSREVRAELRTALDEEKVIVPVIYQTCRIPRQLRLIQYFDFASRSAEDEVALEEVISALRVPKTQPAKPSKAGSTAVSHPRKKSAVSARHPFEPEMIPIPAGEFLMGSDPDDDVDAEDDEMPQHILNLPGYYLAKTPVTNAQYAAFVEADDYEAPVYWKGGEPPNGKEDHPVVEVSWYDALAYCEWLAEMTGKPYRLPSEAEWEKGARGADGLIYPWGDEWEAELCNSEDEAEEDTTPVGDYPEGASPYGLLDMAGNVDEWTRSLWGKDSAQPDFKYPYDPEDGRENLEAGDSIYRVLRGGTFEDDETLVRCACRYGEDPDISDESIGFRVALAPKGP